MTSIGIVSVLPKKESLPFWPVLFKLMYNPLHPLNERQMNNDLYQILSQTLEEIKHELGDSFSLDSVNLAELERRTGISRARLRRLKLNGFVDKPHANCGKRAPVTLLSGFTGIIDDFLKKGITNSNVIFEHLKNNGYAGGKTIIKEYTHVISGWGPRDFRVGPT